MLELHREGGFGFSMRRFESELEELRYCVSHDEMIEIRDCLRRAAHMILPILPRWLFGVSFTTCRDVQMSRFVFCSEVLKIRLRLDWPEECGRAIRLGVSSVVKVLPVSVYECRQSDLFDIVSGNWIGMYGFDHRPYRAAYFQVKGVRTNCSTWTRAETVDDAMREIDQELARVALAGMV